MLEGRNGAHGPWQQLMSNTLRLNVKPWTTFAEFVDLLYDSWLRNAKRYVGRVPNPHFEPMSSQCNLKQGMQYTHFLKLEDQYLWFLDFADQLHLTEFAASGWEEWHGKNGKDSCFYAPLGLDCYSYYTLRKREPDVAANVLNPRVHTWHSTSASSKLNAYYTKTAARKVTDMYAEDFRLFNYSLWIPDKAL